MSWATLPTPPPKKPPVIEPIDFFHSALALTENGIQATAYIPSGTVLLREVPLAVIEGKSTKETKIEDKILSRLRPKWYYTQRDASIATNSSKNDDSLPFRLDSHENIVYFGPDVSDELTRCSAVLPILSKCSHSCSPNSTLHIPIRWKVSESTVLTLISAKAIEAGQYLSFSRVEVIQSPSVRKSQLRSILPLECECKHCGTSEGMSSFDRILTGAKNLPENRAETIEELRRLYDSAFPPQHQNTMDTKVLKLTEEDKELRQQKVLQFLKEANAYFVDTHWRMVHARVAAIVHYISKKEFGAAWEMLCQIVPAVAKIQPLVFPESQRLTMELADYIIRGWQAMDPISVLEITGGNLLNPKSSNRSWMKDMITSSQLTRTYLEYGSSI